MMVLWTTCVWVAVFAGELTAVLAEVSDAGTGNCPSHLGCQCSSTSTSEWHVDCSALGLTSIPTGLPTYTTALVLSYNPIEVISPHPLAELPKLQILDCSYNNISCIINGSFQQLTSLQELYLIGNKIDFTDSDVITSMGTIPSLRLLDIRQNVAFNVSYPSDMWQNFPWLQELRMDGIHGQFGEEFMYLSRLQSLSFRGSHCDIRSIESDTFVGFRNSSLRRLDLEYCNITSFSGQAFNHLRFLSMLSLAFNPLGYNVLEMASGLQNTTIVHLDLNSTGLPDNLQDLFNDYLCNTSLKWLTIANNSVRSFGEIDIMASCFPQLEVFSAAENMIFGEGTTAEYFAMESIRYLNLSNQLQYGLSGRRKRFSEAFCQLNEACPVSLPKTLEVVDISNNGMHLPQVPEITFMNNMSLKIILASNTGLSKLLGPWYCRHRPTIEKIDVSENGLDFVHQDVFGHCNWTSMKTLLLGGNRLGTAIKIQANQTFFSKLYGLQVSVRQ